MLACSFTFCWPLQFFQKALMRVDFLDAFTCTRVAVAAGQPLAIDSCLPSTTTASRTEVSPGVEDGAVINWPFACSTR